MFLSTRRQQSLAKDIYNVVTISSNLQTGLHLDRVPSKRDAVNVQEVPVFLITVAAVSGKPFHYNMYRLYCKISDTRSWASGGMSLPATSIFKRLAYSSGVNKSSCSVIKASNASNGMFRSS